MIACDTPTLVIIALRPCANEINAFIAPKQISITHTDGPHLRARCKKGKTTFKEKQHQREKRSWKMKRPAHPFGDFMMSTACSKS